MLLLLDASQRQSRLFLEYTDLVEVFPHDTVI